MLTDRGSRTADAFEKACDRHRLAHRETRPYTPKTNGPFGKLRGVERFNGRVQREVLGITIHGHTRLAIVSRGFNQAYNARCQRALNGLSPEMILQLRLSARPALANPRYKPTKEGAREIALHIIADAKEVSQPDS